MLKDKLSRVFSSKIFYIIFSIFASVAIWMYVEFTQNPTDTHRVDNIEIVLLNRDILHGRNLVITSVMPETVALTYEGKRSELPKLNNSSLSVTVDLANITSTGTFYPTYSRPVLPAEVDDKAVTLVQRSIERITITVDKLSEKSVPVIGKYDGGTISDEYIAETTPEFSPFTVTVYGPDAAVSRVHSAYVPILKEKLSSTYTEELPYIFLDENGEEVSQQIYNAISCDVETIRVAIPVKMVKEVILTAELLPGAGATAQNTKVSVTPSKITLSGEPDAIRDFNSITLGTIDLSKIDLTTSQMMSIVIPNNYTNLSGETEALVAVDVLGLEIKHVQTSNLQVVNVPRGFTANIITRSLDVRIRGSEEDLMQLVESNIRVVADLTNYSPGGAQVPARVYIDGDDSDIGAVGEYKIHVTVLKE